MIYKAFNDNGNVGIAIASNEDDLSHIVGVVLSEEEYNFYSTALLRHDTLHIDSEGNITIEPYVPVETVDYVLLAKLRLGECIVYESGAYQRQMTQEQKDEFIAYQDALYGIAYQNSNSEIPEVPEFINELNES